MAINEKPIILDETGKEIVEALKNIKIRLNDDAIVNVYTTKADGSRGESVLSHDEQGVVANIPYIPEELTDFPEGELLIKENGVNRVALTGSYSDLVSGKPTLILDKAAQPLMLDGSINFTDEVLKKSDFSDLFDGDAVDLSGNDTVRGIYNDLADIRLKYLTDVEAPNQGLLDRATSLERTSAEHTEKIEELDEIVSEHTEKISDLEYTMQHKVGNFNGLPTPARTVVENINDINLSKQNKLNINSVDSGLVFDGTNISVKTWDTAGQPADAVTGLVMDTTNNVLKLNFEDARGLTIDEYNRLTTETASDDTFGVIKVDTNTLNIVDGKVEIRNPIPDFNGEPGVAPLYNSEGNIELVNVATQEEFDALVDKLDSGAIIVDKAKRDQNGNIINETYLKGVSLNGEPVPVVVDQIANVPVATAELFSAKLGVVKGDFESIKIADDGTLSVKYPTPTPDPTKKGYSLIVDPNGDGTTLAWSRDVSNVNDVQVAYEDSEGNQRTESVIDPVAKVAKIELGFGVTYDSDSKTIIINNDQIATQTEIDDLKSELNDGTIVAGKAVSDETGARISDTYLKAISVNGTTLPVLAGQRVDIQKAEVGKFGVVKIDNDTIVFDEDDPTKPIKVKNLIPNPTAAAKEFGYAVVVTSEGTLGFGEAGKVNDVKFNSVSVVDRDKTRATYKEALIYLDSETIKHSFTNPGIKIGVNLGTTLTTESGEIEVKFDDNTLKRMSDGSLQVHDVHYDLLDATTSEGLLGNILPWEQTLSDTNKLASQDWTNDKIVQALGSYRGTYLDLGDSAGEGLYDKYPVGLEGNSKKIANNDYAYVGEVDSEGFSWMVRYKALAHMITDPSGQPVLDSEGLAIWHLDGWEAEYKFKVSAFTLVEEAALHSGINQVRVTKYDQYESKKQDKLTQALNAGDGITISTTQKINVKNPVPDPTAEAISKGLSVVVTSEGLLGFGEAGKVDDVVINGTSIVTNKIATVPDDIHLKGNVWVEAPGLASGGDRLVSSKNIEREIFISVDDYNALTTKDPKTLYIVPGSSNAYPVGLITNSTLFNLMGEEFRLNFADGVVKMEHSDGTPVQLNGLSVAVDNKTVKVVDNKLEAKNQFLSCTLPSSAEGTVTVSVAGITKDDHLIIDLDSSDDATLAKKEIKEWAKVYKAESVDGGIKFYLSEDVENNLNLSIVIA